MADMFCPKESEESFRFGFEADFDYRVPRIWITEHWSLAYYVVVVYLLFVSRAQEWMRKREGFKLQGLLILWNMLLAGFSIFGTLRVVPEMWDLINQPNGFHRSVCSPMSESSNTFTFWSFIFTLSKTPELGDTVFIILRKQRLILLHWYHHVTVLLYSWHSYIHCIGPSRWFVTMNFSVHALMYSYYVLKAQKIRVPKTVAAFITGLQILQMLAGIFILMYSLSVKLTDSDCDIPYINIFWALVMYGSYFYLFTKFFQESYLKRSNFREKKKLG